VKEFLIPLNWFYIKYFGKLNQRYWTFKVALNLFHQLPGQIIVETGCVREKDDWAGGNSTTIFGDYAAHYSKRLVTVDIDETNLNLAKEVTKEYAPYIEYHLSDSVEFLKTFDKPIDLLYLDSVDFPEGKLLERYGGKEDIHKAIRIVEKLPRDEYYEQLGELVGPCQEHALNEYLAAKPNLTERSIVLVDDYDLPFDGKAYLVNQQLEKEGWTCLIGHTQILWIR
jgi:hypothetical protein